MKELLACQILGEGKNYVRKQLCWVNSFTAIPNVTLHTTEDTVFFFLTLFLKDLF